MSFESEAIEIVRDAVGAEGPFEAEMLSPGCSGSNVVKVTSRSIAYVVRFWNMQWADYFAQDKACQIIGSEASYGPRVFFVDETKGITVMEYHRPDSLPEGEARHKLLATLLKKIHTGPIVPKGIDRAIYIEQQFKEAVANPYSTDLAHLKAIKDEVFSVTRQDAINVPCHRDLHPGNLLYTKGNYLAIDYTWAAMDDAYADLANIAIFNCVDQEEEERLLESYLDRKPRPRELARLALMKLPAKMFYGLEFLWLANQDSTPEQAEPNPAASSYKDFGHHGVTTHKEGFRHYGRTLLSEIVDYSVSEQYRQNLAHFS